MSQSSKSSAAPKVFAVLSLYAEGLKGQRVLLQKLRVNITPSLVTLYAPPDSMGAQGVQSQIDLLEKGTPAEKRRVARDLVWAAPYNPELAPVGALVSALQGLKIPGALDARIEVDELKAWKKAEYPDAR
ncbi:hypothetical protein E3E11_01965 [Oecophyllibacter saccharovorans]|uniref:Uncharacterized protein n=1 Tax=Oecophyllibacter saccharovorans TaxID=2558360 RepID=A0A506URN5_9PROT|nr:hypothetical protein [Oecophyllibacter saccharovorans]QDH14830.1 hypothetical protein E3E11_01965 [Oecophyllibacter saccharovorans]TPW35972.1 hypothetical protein E3202_03390 [Oecophyllibacter saccharovorans]